MFHSALFLCVRTEQNQQNLELNPNEPKHDYENVWEGMMNEEEQAMEIQTSECPAYASVLKREKEIETVECVAYASVTGTK